MAEEREEEEEAGVEKASQLPPFLADFPAILEDYARVSSEYPYLQARFGIVRVDQKLRSRRWTR